MVIVSNSKIRGGVDRASCFIEATKGRSRELFFLILMVTIAIPVNARFFWPPKKITETLFIGVFLGRMLGSCWR